MMPITKAQSQALVALIHQLRHDWDLPGIASAVRKASTLGPFTDLAIAATRCAANQDMRTPALIAEPGPHWLGLATGKRIASPTCSEHPQRNAGHCPECIAQAIPKPHGFVIPKPLKRPFVPDENHQLHDQVAS